MHKLQGIWLPLITPFEGGNIDFKSFDRLLQHYAQTNLHGVLIGGTTGESHALSDCELHRLVQRACDVLKPSMKVLLGVCGSATADFEAHVRDSAGLPIDGLVITAPPYIRPSQDGLYRHFEACAAATSHDLVIYNIPYRTAVNISNDTLRALAALPNIIGVKDCCGDAEQSADLLVDRRPGFAVLTGEDRNIVASLKAGADGAISACAHLAPFDLVSIYNRIANGETEIADALFDRLTGIIDILFSEPNPMPLKYWLYREGLIRSPECRLPLTAISHDLAERINGCLLGARAAHRHVQIPA